MNNFQNIKQRYNELKAERDKYVARWNEVSKYVGIRLDPQQYFYDESNKSEDLDKYTEDPTAALSVQQSADYLKGIMWGNGVNAVSLLPSDDVLSIANKEEVDRWYKYATNQLLYQMNHSDAGLNTSLNAYFYDQQSFGTSGVGCFPNSGYGKGNDTNVLLFRPYGVDTLAIDEGKNGLVDVVFNTYRWRTNRLVQEFCEKEDGFDQKAFEKLPKKVQDAYNNNQLNLIFNIVQAVMPREDYTPNALGKNGCKYVGYWFEESDDKPFHEEDYKTLPIAVARAIKIRGEVYGRSSGTLLISTIRCINQAVSETMQAMAKMVRPPIGILNTALFGDDVVDTSENGLTVFNAGLLNGADPLIKMQDLGDPSTLVQWLVPYLNEKVATAFKIDILLDFSAQSDMTATESLQRFSIRGRSISGMIMQQKTELFEPLIRRCVSICMDKGVLGVNPEEAMAEDLMSSGFGEKVIPQAVLDCIEQGKPWFEIHFNNEVEKLGKTEKVDDLLKLINAITALMAVNPQIGSAIEWYKLISDVSDALGFKDNIVSEKQFKAEIEKQAQQQAQLMQAQAGQLNAAANRDNATALKDMNNGQEAQ